jgi:hypothetical protein
MFDHFPEGPLKVRKGRGERSPPWINDDVPLWIELCPVQAERFPQASLDAISDHASTDSARNREAQSRGAIAAFVRPVTSPCKAKSRE